MKIESIEPSAHYDTQAPRFKNWETPRDFFDKLDAEFHFDFDAAASHENALCLNYATPEGNFYRREKVGPADGLTLDWGNLRVFCNPPYTSEGVKAFVNKAFLFEAKVAVLLLPPNFETEWGQRIWKEFLAEHDHAPYPLHLEIRLPPGRLRFWHPALKPGFKLKDYEKCGEDIFDYSLPHIPGDAPRAGNLIAVFRR